MLTIRRVVLTGVLAALAGTQAWAVTPIASCPFTISAPGNYVVTADLTCMGVAINVNASNVTVSLNGHIITSVVGINGVGISVSPVAGPRLNHVGISGPGVIQGFNTGDISIQLADYVQVTRTTLVGSALLGGIFAQNVTYLTVAGNVIAANGGVGLTLAQSNGAQVTGNQIVANLVGIFLQSGDSNALAGNDASGNTQSGIGLGANFGPVPLTNTRVSSNTTNGNGLSGIQVFPLLVGSFGNEIFSNVSSVGNKAFDMEDDNPGCGTDFWSSNVFFTKSPVACIH